MSREKNSCAMCHTCKVPLLGQKCICRSCLTNPNHGLGDLYAKRRELLKKSNELQESLQVLTKGQEIEEIQQMELRLWRNKAQKAIIARQKAVAKLQALSTTRQAIENNKASFGLALYLEAMKRKYLTIERRLLDKLLALEVEKMKLRRWAVEDINMVLEGTVKPPAGKFDGICKSITSSIDLIDQCAADNKLAKYYSDAFGQYILLLAAISTVFHLPLRNQYKYQGVRSEIWVPSTFYDYKPEQRTTKPHVICLTAPSGSSNAEMYRKEMAQALEFLERSAAVAVSVDPSQLVPRSSVVGSPLQWIVDVCEAAMREKSSKKGAKTHPSLRQSVLVMAGSQDEAMAMEVEGTEEGKENHEVIQRDRITDQNAIIDDGDWELLMAADAEAAIEMEAERSTPSLISMVNRVKTFAYSYTGR